MREKLALREVKDIYNQLYAIGDVLDKKAMSLLANSSLVLTLFSILQISLVNDVQPKLYKIGVIAIFVLYLLLVISILIIMLPKNYRTVFEHTGEAVNRAILNQETDNDAYIQLIVNYLDRIEENKAIDTAKRKWLFFGLGLFILIMILIVCLSLFVVR